MKELKDYTKEEIRILPAGEDLDYLMYVIYMHGILGKDYLIAVDIAKIQIGCYESFQYSRNNIASINVLEKTGKTYTISKYKGVAEEVDYEVIIDIPDDSQIWSVEVAGETLALAISRAIVLLTWLELKEKQNEDRDV